MERLMRNDWSETLFLIIAGGLILLAAATFAGAQNVAEIVLGDGTRVLVTESRPVAVTPRVTAVLARDHLRIRNGGNPDRFNTTAFTPEPWYFREIVITCPGRRPQLWPFDLSAPGPGAEQWTVAGEQSFKHGHHEALDPAQPWYLPSRTLHMLDGGDTFYVRLTTLADPYELGPSTPLQIAEATRISDIDQTLLSGWPLARANLDLYRFDASSLDPAAQPRTQGWFLVPEFFVSKWTGWSRDLSEGWYAFPDHQLPGDGICNAHYGHDWAWLASFLQSGDAMRRTIGLAVLRQKCATGLFDVDRPYPACRYQGMWRGEKAGVGRRGSSLGPMPSKEWDVGLLCGAALDPECPLIARAVAVRRARLLGVAPADIWNGAGGGRLAGNYLRNLRDHFVASGDPALRAKADLFVAHVWRVFDARAAAWNPQHPGQPMRWFPNLYDPNVTAAWEEATLHAELFWWATQGGGVGAGRLADLDPMVEWLVVACSGPRGQTGEWQVAYQKNVLTGVWTSNTPGNGLWWVPLAGYVRARLPHLRPQAEQWTATAFRRHGQTWAEVDQGRAPYTAATLTVDTAGEGPGAFKQRAYATRALRR